MFTINAAKIDEILYTKSLIDISEIIDDVIKADLYDCKSKAVCDKSFKKLSIAIQETVTDIDDTITFNTEAQKYLKKIINNYIDEYEKSFDDISDYNTEDFFE